MFFFDVCIGVEILFIFFVNQDDMYLWVMFQQFQGLGYILVDFIVDGVDLFGVVQDDLVQSGILFDVY